VARQISAGPAALEGGQSAPLWVWFRRPACLGGVHCIGIFSRSTSHDTLAMVAQRENPPYADQTIDLDPNVRDQWGVPAPRLNYDWRRSNELARVGFMFGKMEGIGRAMGASHVWRGPLGSGAPGRHHEGGTRMGSDSATSVVKRHGQSWDIPNLFGVGSSYRYREIPVLLCSQDQTCCEPSSVGLTGVDGAANAGGVPLG
jgi:gluconate 2-dehydrogenase alpha chain